MTQILPSDAGFLDHTMPQKNNYSFVEEAIETIREVYKPGDVRAADSIRRKLEDAGVKPDYQNAWGTLFRTAVGRRLLVPTGRWFYSYVGSAKRRKLPEYVVAR